MVTTTTRGGKIDGHPLCQHIFSSRTIERRRCFWSEEGGKKTSSFLLNVLSPMTSPAPLMGGEEKDGASTRTPTPMYYSYYSFGRVGGGRKKQNIARESIASTASTSSTRRERATTDGGKKKRRARTDEKKFGQTAEKVGRRGSTRLHLSRIRIWGTHRPLRPSSSHLHLDAERSSFFRKKVSQYDYVNSSSWLQYYSIQ